MKVTLILATINRTEELNNFLVSLGNQTYKDFELIIVDQNHDNRLEPILKNYAEYVPIKWLKSPIGLSRSRNVGLSYINGEVVGFPDDDCWYWPETLEKVIKLFKAHSEWDGFTGKSEDSNGQPSAGEFDRKAGPINRYNIWKRGLSISIFLKREIIDELKGFDESLGIGSGTPWGSGEETDYLLRAINAGFRILYNPTITIGHSNPVTNYDSKAINRALLYGGGMGKVLKKHNYPFWFKCYYLLRPIVGGLILLATGQIDKLRFNLAVFKGRFNGVFK